MLDPVDAEILEILGRDARVSNREIGQRLGLAEGTIRSRIKRMIDTKAIRITAITRDQNNTPPTMCFVGLRVELTTLQRVAREVTELSEVRFVATTIGRYDILCIVLVESIDALTSLISDKIMSMKGVRRSYTSIATKTIKYDHRWGKVD
ncbi:MAG: Lrp/AsnC family transcriptional regulator [Pseudomonadota bacterium]